MGDIYGTKKTKGGWGMYLANEMTRSNNSSISSAAIRTPRVGESLVGGGGGLDEATERSDYVFFWSLLYTIAMKPLTLAVNILPAHDQNPGFAIQAPPLVIKPRFKGGGAGMYDIINTPGIFREVIWLPDQNVI